MRHLPKKYLIVLGLAIFISLSGFFISQVFSAAHNSLYNNQNWIVTKTLLKKGVWGAYGFLGSSNSLAGNKLDLSKWHGFQEVIYKDALEMREVTFDFLLGQEAYLAFIFNKNENGFYGIRISRRDIFKSMYFTSKNSGEFVVTEDLSIPALRPQAWNRFKMVFRDDGFSVYLNGESVKNIKCELSKRQSIGFRGGERKALIDNIQIRTRNSSQIIHESFENKKRSLFFIYCLIAVLALNASAALFLKKRVLSDPLLKLLILNIYLAFFSFLYSQTYSFFLGLNYPKEAIFARTMPKDLLMASNRYWADSSERFIRRHINETYGPENRENIFRILFVGTSQTWGAGASEVSRTFTNVLEKRLNQSGSNGIRYECINAGILGSNSSALLNIYKDEWIMLFPEIVIINLANNDDDPKVFYSNLEAFVKLNREHNIKTVFVFEPNSIERSPFALPLHKVMREMAEENDILTLDLHGHLLENYDRGFLWWDSVHLTDFGQELTAGYLFEAIRRRVPFVGGQLMTGTV